MTHHKLNQRLQFNTNWANEAQWGGKTQVKVMTGKRSFICLCASKVSSCSHYFSKALLWAGNSTMIISDQDTGRQTDKLCSFLGMSPSAEEKQRVLDRVQFDTMKPNTMVNRWTFTEMDFKVSSVIKKGTVNSDFNIDKTSSLSTFS